MAFFGDVDGARAVSLADFDALAHDEPVVLVDVRPATEYATGHVAGAINIPVAELAAPMADLPVDTRVIAYCRGPYCVMAATADGRLREAGHDAARLQGGFPDWAASGRPVAS